MAYGLHKIQFGTASTLLVGHRDGWDLLVDNSHLTLKEAPRWALFGVQESVDPHLKTRLQALTNEDKCEHSAEGYRFSFEEYRGLGAEERTIFFGFCGWLLFH